LIAICKSYEEIKKTEKEKEENKIKIEKGSGGTFRPSRRSNPQPIYYLPEPVPYLTSFLR
jgi:hypothetical protein